MLIQELSILLVLVALGFVTGVFFIKELRKKLNKKIDERISEKIDKGHQ